MKVVSAAAMALALFLSTGAGAQVAPVPSAPNSQALSQAQRAAVVQAVKAAYAKSYVFPNKVPAILAQLDKGMKSGRYNVMSANELAGQITSDLQAASKDGHAYLQYDPQRYAAATAEGGAGASLQNLSVFEASASRRDHHGLAELRILPGNVRYLKISGFRWVPDESGQAYDDAMRFLRDGDAVIIDLRGNGGGASEAVQYLVSHFLKPGTLEITFLQAGHEPVQTRVLDNLPAGRMVGKPLYVLTDQGTASAAESFAYDVQQFKLGTLVGSGTAGAANNNDFVAIAPGFMLSVSTGRPVHPVSKTNWEGTGVQPEVAVAPPQALDEAQVLALQALAARALTPELKADYAWALPEAEARLHPVTISPAIVQAAPGSYGKYIVATDKGGLTLARPGHPLWPAPRRLSLLTADGLFAVDGVDILRVGFKPGALELFWKDEPAPRLIKRD
ncbi:S41 family peptidase [Sphingomonas trueperi]|uniref:S41 family peptidase n=1 Tax=Sphingomonas trueperi TaxID=53317 RepID=UPI001C7DF335